MKKVIAIVGPTAVGKTKLSIEVAKKFNGEIISGDAMQIYRGLDIGTAKITTEEMEGIKHHLIDEKNPDEPYSVAEFQKAVRAKIEDISTRGKVPIIVGGTGLYVKAVLYDYEFSETALTNEEQYETLTNEEVHEKLASIDPESAKMLHPNNRRRVVRAINIYYETNKTKSETLEKQDKKLMYDVLLIGLTDERSVLYERINARVDNMIAHGLIDEVGALHHSGIVRETQAIQAIGYKEIYDYLDGMIDLETAVELVKRNSRRLAKRQYTWFRNQMDVTWFDVDVTNFEQTVDAVTVFVKERLEHGE
jgi:tRNA dimethylallyltransferase